MEKSRHGAFVYAQKVLKHSLFLFLLISQSPGKRHPILRMSSITLLLMTGFGLSKDRFLKIQNRLIHYQE